MLDLNLSAEKEGRERNINPKFCNRHVSSHAQQPAQLGARGELQGTIGGEDKKGMFWLKSQGINEAKSVKKKMKRNTRGEQRRRQLHRQHQFLLNIVKGRGFTPVNYKLFNLYHIYWLYLLIFR